MKGKFYLYLRKFRPMKRLTLILILCMLAIGSFSQDSDSLEVNNSTYRIIQTDGNEVIGKILRQDEREVYVLTIDDRKIYIPQFVIKEIVLLKSSDFNSQGSFIGEDAFATRYFITTNGLPIKKGEHYVQWNLYGPDFHFAVRDDLSIGFTTSWVGIPIIGNIKKSWQLKEKTHVALGALVGTGSWAAPSFAGVLPFGSISFGDRSKNIAFSAGYGAIFIDGEVAGRAMTSVAGMIKLSNKISIVFDSFILLPGQTTTETRTYDSGFINPTTGLYESEIITESYQDRQRGFALIIPGLRWHKSAGKAFQIGFTAVTMDGGFSPFPIPTIQWYRKL
jgi:hypothetical protein